MFLEDRGVNTELYIYPLKKVKMGNLNEKVQAASAEIAPPVEPPKKLKPCCACPETKRARDEW